MVLSVEDVCNKALSQLPASVITSIDENSAEAVRCKSVYDGVRDSVLAAHWWSFATKIGALTLLATETVSGWAYLYRMPSGSIEVRRVFQDAGLTIPPNIDFKQVISPTTGFQVIGTNITSPYAEYTWQVVDPQFYPPYFVDALALKLAAEVGPGLSGSRTIRNDMLSLYGVALSEAKRLDGNRKSVAATKESSYVTARG